MSHTQFPGSTGAPLDRSHVSLGLASIGTGLIAGFYAWQYGVGTGTEMGPGFFPLAVSVLLILLGGLVILRGGADLPPAEASVEADAGFAAPGDTVSLLHTLRVLGSVLGGIAVFALTVRPLGLLISVTILSAIVSLGHPGVRLRPILVLSVALAVGAVLIFVVALRLNLNALPSGY